MRNPVPQGKFPSPPHIRANRPLEVYLDGIRHALKTYAKCRAEFYGRAQERRCGSCS